MFRVSNDLKRHMTATFSNNIQSKLYRPIIFAFKVCLVVLLFRTEINYWESKG